MRRAVEGVAGRAAGGRLGELGARQPRPAALRIPERAGRDQAKVGMLLLLTLRGTPTIYYGEEIGMVDVPVATADARDPLERREPGRGRDPERSPMQWDASPNAGFTPRRRRALAAAGARRRPRQRRRPGGGPRLDPDPDPRLLASAARAPGPPPRRLRALRPDPGRHVRLPAHRRRGSPDASPSTSPAEPRAVPDAGPGTGADRHPPRPRRDSRRPRRRAAPERGAGRRVGGAERLTSRPAAAPGCSPSTAPRRGR